MSVTSTPLRQFIYTSLLPLEKGQKFQRLHMEDVLSYGYETHHFSPEDRRFGTFLAYGILRNWFALSHALQEYSNMPIKKLDPAVRLLLRMGMYQLIAMESVPDYAAVSSTMELATALGISKKGRGFINAILNGFIRKGKPFPDDSDKRLPEWLLERLKAQYPEETIKDITTAYSRIPVMALRVNTLKVSVAAYAEALHQKGIAFKTSEAIPEVLFVTLPQGDPRELPGYEDGWFVVQDESSARVARFLAPQPGETVLEFGAAPGTKTTHLAALMENTGRILAVDSSAKRMEKLTENCQRLGVSIVEPVIQKGQSLPAPEHIIDRVLIDAPCSGTGTAGKHPEILLVLQEKEFSRFTQEQSGMLDSGFTLLKSCGVLVYSTCSIDAAENQEIVQSFLQKQGEAAHLEEELKIMPSETHDGFYMARILKR